MSWPGFRVSLDSYDGPLDLRFEIKTKSACSAFVKPHRFIELSPGRAVNHNGLHECFARSSENTLSAGSPASRQFLISAARRPNSASHAASVSLSDPESSD